MGLVTTNLKKVFKFQGNFSIERRLGKFFNISQCPIEPFNKVTFENGYESKWNSCSSQALMQRLWSITRTNLLKTNWLRQRCMIEFWHSNKMIIQILCYPSSLWCYAQRINLKNYNCKTLVYWVCRIFSQSSLSYWIEFSVARQSTNFTWKWNKATHLAEKKSFLIMYVTALSLIKFVILFKATNKTLAELSIHSLTHFLNCVFVQKRKEVNGQRTNFSTLRPTWTV